MPRGHRVVYSLGSLFFSGFLCSDEPLVTLGLFRGIYDRGLDPVYSASVAFQSSTRCV